jgi:hypothetical protein
VFYFGDKRKGFRYLLLTVLRGKKAWGISSVEADASSPVPARYRIFLLIDTGEASGYDSSPGQEVLFRGACFFEKIVVGMAPIF